MSPVLDSLHACGVAPPLCVGVAESVGCPIGPNDDGKSTRDENSCGCGKGRSAAQGSWKDFGKGEVSTVVICPAVICP